MARLSWSVGVGQFGSGFDAPLKLVEAAIVGSFVLCLLAGCGFYSPKIPSPPAELVAPCGRPATLPDRGMSQYEVEQFWRRDRIALADCGDRLEGLAGFMEELR